MSTTVRDFRRAPKRARRRELAAPRGFPGRVLPSRAVVRRALFLVFAIFLIQETDLGSLLVGAECYESCASDTSPGHCPPTCATCSCTTHANPVPPSVARLSSPEAREVPETNRATMSLSDGHAGDIRHVPKPFLA